MEGIFGLRAWRAVAQPQDDTGVDELAATKEAASDREPSGAQVEVWIPD